MPTEYVIWCREDKTIPGPNGQTYKTSADANAALRRLIGKSGGERSEPGKKTYDVVAITVP